MAMPEAQRKRIQRFNILYKMDIKIRKQVPLAIPIYI